MSPDMRKTGTLYTGCSFSKQSGFVLALAAWSACAAGALQKGCPSCKHDCRHYEPGLLIELLTQAVVVYSICTLNALWVPLFLAKAAPSRAD